MHTLGLLGMPRRTQIGEAPYLKPEWEALLPFVMVGALIMLVSAILYYVNMVMTITAGKPQAEHAIPLAQAQSGPEDAPAILDRWTPWVVIAIALVLINYAPLLFQLVTTSPFNIPGMRSW
jgi:cytochrome c oxidase subunit 1